MENFDSQQVINKVVEMQKDQNKHVLKATINNIYSNEFFLHMN